MSKRDFIAGYMAALKTAGWMQMESFGDPSLDGWQNQYDGNAFGMIGEAYEDGDWQLFGSADSWGNHDFLDYGHEKDLESAIAACDESAMAACLRTSRKAAGINWSEEYDGSLWATEDAGDAGRVQFNIMPPDDGGYWWSAYAVDPDIELGDGIASSLEDAKQNCDNILRNVRHEFTASRAMKHAQQTLYDYEMVPTLNDAKNSLKGLKSAMERNGGTPTECYVYFDAIENCIDKAIKRYEAFASVM